MTAVDQACEWCGEALLISVKSTAKYCSGAHRMAAFRERRRTVTANLDRFNASAIEADHRRWMASTRRRDRDYEDARDEAATSWAPPPMPTVQPDTQLDEIDRWIRAPIPLE